MDRPDVTMMFVVHNAFRRDLARMQAAAAHARDPAARTALRAGWATFSRYLTVHHTAEDEILWPPMQAQLGDRPDETDLLVEMAREHSRLDPVMREIDEDSEWAESSPMPEPDGAAYGVFDNSIVPPAFRPKILES